MSKTSIDWLPELGIRECRSSGPTMGTRYSARFLAAATGDLRRVVADLASAVTAVDQQMSNWKAESDLSRLNRVAPGIWTPIAPALATVLQRALQIGRETGNAFNVGVGDLVEAWGFGPGGDRQPPRSPPRARAPLDDLLELDLPNRRARKHGPVILDLGGIAKGFGVDELARVLDAHGLTAWLVGIDGEMRARGAKADGSAWAVAIEAPHDEERAALGVLELADAAIATSGDYRHWRLVDGHRVSHTMDPRAGAPAGGALASVTVVTGCCMDADAYATALMVAGPAAGRRLALRLGLDALFVARDGERLNVLGTGCFEGGPSGAPG